ncbi:MAG: hypothetical protein QM656_17035 [Paracoccaceae bacterium]
MKHVLLALALVAGAASPALAFRASNGLEVRSLGGNRFLVPWRGQSGDTAFWCAAADYAWRGLGLPAAARVWRISEPPRRAGQGIVFSTSAKGAASDSGITRIGGGKRPDFSIGAALAFCDRRPVDFD